MIPGLTLFRCSAPTPPVDIVYEPALCLIAQGSKHVALGDEEYRYDPKRYLLISADVPATAWVSRASANSPYLGLKLLLDPLTVGEVVAQVGARHEAPVARAMVVATLDPGLVDAVCRLVAAADEPNDALVLAPLVRREIIYRLLVGPEGARLRQVVSGADHGQRITRVLRWLKDHYTEPLSIETIARRAGMSPSGFHRHFKAVTALSPLQYQKRLRLQQARRLMLGGALDAAEAGFQVGYESASQFSREYRRLFGAPPGRDIEALRQRGPSAAAAL